MGGKLADRGRGVEPLTHIRPIYCAHAVLMASLIVTHWVPVYGALLLVVLGMFMYLQNSASQVLYMDVASQSHPGSLNLAASLNSMSFNIGIAVGSAVGGLVNAHLGLDVAWPCGRDLPAVCGWHHNPAAPVRSSRTRFLRQTASLMAFGRV